MTLSKNQIFSILGLSLIIGCFRTMMNLPQLIMLCIGFGILVGGIFREIQTSKNDGANPQINLTRRKKLFLIILFVLVIAIQITLLTRYLR